MSTTRLREAETALSTPLHKKPSDLPLGDSLSPNTELSLISPPGPPVLVKQTPVHHYNLRTQHPGSTPGYGSISLPRWSSTPLSCVESATSSETPVGKISSSPAVLGTGQGKEGKGILDFQKRLDVIECREEEVDSGFESLIQNEDSLIQNKDEERKEERTVADKLDEARAASNLVSSASEIPPSLGAVAKRRSPRNKQKPSTDRLERKQTTKTVRSSREGQEACDFLRRFVQMQMDHVLGAIFSHLSSLDLCRIAQVSSTWASALQGCKSQDHRRLAFISDMKREKENLAKENFLGRRISPRRAMANIINRTSPSAAKRDRNHSASALVSPSKVRHKLFVDEGRKLSDGQRLVACPQCSSPSRVSSVPVTTAAASRPAEKASCSSSQCNFVFCPECKCPDHPDRPCRPRRTSYKLSKSGGVSSQKSKNRLRKL